MNIHYLNLILILILAVHILVIIGHPATASLVWRRIGLLLITLFLPITYLIDLVVGDFVTGVHRTAKEKLSDHKRMWIEIWQGR